MKQPSKTFRCAIYTRKSTEHNLDLEFNSLDAQREACEAYIKSQMHEGWVLIPGRYDDGGLSGASLDRPALQTLLSDLRAGKVDIIVVYKVDRLTRSLGDFAKLVEQFDQHSVTFVSVTQSFNTTSSMGRLTLNVLLSFAQFEREVIGERVRDKIAASKKKGIWVGGSIPLGYASVEKKLVVVSAAAATVRFIFQRYLEVGSIRLLVQDLDQKGIRTRQQVLSNGKSRGGIRFGVGPLAHLLKNRFYVGEIAYRGEIHKGEHEPIVDRDLFDAVQARLAANANEQKIRLRASPAILIGHIFDDRGNRMTPTHTNKKGVRYRYYISHAVLQRRRAAAGSVVRVPAQEIETMVIQAVRNHLNAGADGSPSTERDRHLVIEFVEKVIVQPQAIQVQLVSSRRTSETLVAATSDVPFHKTEVASRPVTIELPWSAPQSVALKGVIHTPSIKRTLTPGARQALLTAIAKARQWIIDLTEGHARSFAEIAKLEGKVERHIRLLAPLAFVSPRVVAAIVHEAAPAGLTVSGLAKGLPYSWVNQAGVLE